jgi:integrase/recombinase XerD
MKATAALFHDTRKEKKNGTFPVKIQIYFNRVRKYYNTRFEFTKENYLRLFTEKPREPYKSDKKELDALIEKAEDIIGKLGSYFTFEQFHNKYLLNRKDKGNVLTMYEEIIKKLESDEQFGTAVTYKNALSSLKAFTQKTELKIEDVTIDFLHKYEKWMMEPKMYVTKKGKVISRKGNVRTSIGIYLRTLRRIYRLAILDGLVPEIAYPFGRDKYIIPSGRKAKRALKLEEVRKIFTYIPDGGAKGNEFFAKDMWIFSYLGCGINMKDIAFLKYESILGDMIVFFREKTKNTNKDNQVEIKIDLNEKLWEIINKWGNKNTSRDNYIFPILNKEMTARTKHTTVKQTIKNANKYLKRMGIKLSIEMKLTGYVARHTFSNILKNSGASTEFISESLGHADIRTTKNYLGDFEDEKRKEIKNALTAFENVNKKE